jgi:hypothetical protein
VDLDLLLQRLSNVYDGCSDRQFLSGLGSSFLQMIGTNACSLNDAIEMINSIARLARELVTPSIKRDNQMAQNPKKAAAQSNKPNGSERHNRQPKISSMFNTTSMQTQQDAKKSS